MLNGNGTLKLKIESCFKLSLALRETRYRVGSPGIVYVRNTESCVLSQIY